MAYFGHIAKMLQNKKNKSFVRVIGQNTIYDIRYTMLYAFPQFNIKPAFFIKSKLLAASTLNLYIRYNNVHVVI